MITYKHRYTCNNVELIKSYERQYFICLKVVYKYLCKGFTIKQIKERLLTYKNIELIQNNSWFLASLVYEAKALISARDVCLKNLQKRYEDKDFKNYKHKQKIKKIIKQLIQKTICFNKQQHQQRSKNLITNIQFKQNNIFTLCSMGDKLKHANRFFRIQNENTIIFQPNKYTKVNLNLYGHKNHIKQLLQLKHIQQYNLHPITYRLDKEYIYITFDETILNTNRYAPINNRVMAIDINPNYIGYSIIDWYDTENGKFKLIDKGVFSLKNINDYQNSLHIKSSHTKSKYITNKRNYEIYNINKKLITMAKHYKCKFFAMEDLNIKTEDLQRGKRNNRLCINQWNRVKLVQNLQKRCNITGIKFRLVPPEYTSFLGNLVYRYLNLPDMVLASVEISRRCYEFHLQYEVKQKEISKIIRFPKLNNFVKNSIEKAKEALSIPVDFENYLQFYWWIKKNLENRYRVPLSIDKVFRQNYLKFIHIKLNVV